MARAEVRLQQRPLLVEASRIRPGLYQGSIPEPGSAVRRSGFDLLVLCAEEYQPPSEIFPGVEVVHAGYDDDASRPLKPREMQLALGAAKRVASALGRGKSVLVTCAAGRNRSGLVSALALHLVTGRSGLECARHVQRTRKNALTNPRFLELLASLPAAHGQNR